MAGHERLSVSINKAHVEEVRALVEKGAYPSISSVMDEAVGMLLERQKEKEVWWGEVVRRYDHAVAHPEKLVDADSFFKALWHKIGKEKAAK